MAVRDRVKDLRRVRAGDLRPHPENWRLHPQGQREALRAILDEVGWADAILVRELPDGGLGILDGHLRADLDPEQEVPVLVVDLDEEESRKVLLSHDPLGAMAEADSVKLEALLDQVGSMAGMDDGLREMLDSLEVDDAGKVILRPLSTKAPPRMTWVLIGIPTVRFGEIASEVERIAKMDEVILETTVNDGPKD